MAVQASTRLVDLSKGLSLKQGVIPEQMTKVTCTITGLVLLGCGRLRTRLEDMSYAAVEGQSR